MSASKTKPRRRWKNVKGVMTRGPSKAAAAVHRERQAEERKSALAIEANTCGLGNWERPQDWDSTPFSHTVTAVEGISCGWEAGWNIYNAGVVVTLVAHPADGPFERGHPYVWCKTTRGGFGDDRTYPTAPIFGRFIEKDRTGRPVALVGRGKSMTIDEKHDQCFRAVGHVGRGDEFYPRSEVPVPIPSEAVRQTQPMHFDVLQHHLGKLDQILCVMSGITDMTDELADAEKATGKDDPQAQAWRRSRAYEALDSVLTDAMRWSSNTREELDAFLKASPELCYWLKRWQGKPKGGTA